jgi:hypothetical protein
MQSFIQEYNDTKAKFKDLKGSNDVVVDENEALKGAIATLQTNIRETYSI